MTDQIPSGGQGVRLPWGGEERLFRLPLGAQRKIEQKCGVGLEVIAGRLMPTVTALQRGLSLQQSLAMGMVGEYRLDDVREPLFQGLLHGDPDMDPVTVTTLMRDYFDGRPTRKNVPIAFALVMDALEGLPSLEPKKTGEPKGRRRKPSGSPTAASRGARSTSAAAAAD